MVLGGLFVPLLLFLFLLFVICFIDLCGSLVGCVCMMWSCMILYICILYCTLKHETYSLKKARLGLACEWRDESPFAFSRIMDRLEKVPTVR
jgi:hypothetical protein